MSTLELELTIQVLGLAPKVTPGELHTFFSYCGTVDKIQLKRNKDRSQTALITFKQPFAYQTALLLNDAIFGGRPIRIAPATNLACPPSPDEFNVKIKNDELKRLVPALHTEMQSIASKTVEMLKTTKEGMEQAAVYVGCKMATGDFVSTGANWLSNVLDKASKRVGEFETRNRNIPISRKQK